MILIPGGMLEGLTYDFGDFFPSEGVFSLALFGPAVSGGDAATSEGLSFAGALAEAVGAKEG